MALKM